MSRKFGMAKIISYKDLLVWQKAMALVTCIYQITSLFPKAESFGLTSQMKRAALSIPANIAEGSRRGTKRDFRQFLIIAYGSGAELETYIIISKTQLLANDKNTEKAELLLSEIMKMLNKFISNLKI